MRNFEAYIDEHIGKYESISLDLLMVNVALQDKVEEALQIQ